jgi:hypothetical protein
MSDDTKVITEEYAIQHQSVHVVMVDGETILGYLNIAGYNRFSDYLEKHNSAFLTVYDPKKSTLFINKRNIKSIAPR